MRRIFLVLVLVLLPLNIQAKVSVTTGGSSDEVSLVTAKGPVGIKKKVSTKAKGGSIAIATARSQFTKTKITHGNKVISAGTGGDEEFTHVDANSFFAGTATFASDDGNPVENFTIDIGLSGTLKCKSPDETLPTFFSIAQMSTDVIVDGDSKFAGLAIQDGSGPFTASGSISSGDFTIGTNTATIKKSFPINLGTLTDGQKLAFFFLGSTLVSYGADVPITFCSADFFNTDTFQPTKNQAGKLKIEATGLTVTVDLIDDETLIIESSDEELLADIASATVIIGSGGGTFAVTTGDVDDLDEDGISDVILSSDAQQSSMISAILSSFTNTVFVFGQTNAGEAFAGTLDTATLL